MKGSQDSTISFKLKLGRPTNFLMVLHHLGKSLCTQLVKCLTFFSYSCNVKENNWYGKGEDGDKKNHKEIQRKIESERKKETL